MAKTANIEEKKKAIEAAMAQINKQFGAGSLQRLGDTNHLDVETVSTGSILIDKALGVGGLPFGRIVEIYGPEASGKTTLTLHTIAEAQKLGKICAFVDAEHALDPERARTLGVDIDNLLISQPDSGEQALEICDKLVSSGAVDVIVVDSVAALTPKAELEGDMGDSHMGLQARLLSQGLRKLVAKTKENNVLLIFINQLRMKIGVMFGCFHYNARVLLADGTTEKIGKIVNNKMEVEVMSYNDSTGEIEPQPIQDWYNNGKAQQFWNLKVKKQYGNGFSYLPIGDDHLIPTPTGEKRFLDLKIGDEVFGKHKKYLTQEQFEFCIGSILGDGSIKMNSTDGLPSMRFGHGVKQNDYCKWKEKIFNKDFIGYKGYTNKKQYNFATKTTSELIPLNNKISKDDSWSIPQEVIDKMSLISLAIWYLDDGTFAGSYKKYGNGKSYICAKSMRVETLERIIDKLKTFGLQPKLYNTAGRRGIVFYGEDNYQFHQMIAKYVPKCMEYKLHPKLRDIEKHQFDNSNSPVDSLIPVKILDIYKKPSKNSRATNKFDIEVKDNHNYFVDGVLVHNSPETTTGGNALKFYSSVRLDIRRIGSDKKGDEIVANRVKIKVAKNKLAPPFKETETSLDFKKGFDIQKEILQIAVQNDIIKKSGAWYSDSSDPNFLVKEQGEEKMLRFFEANPEYFEKVKEKAIKLITLNETPKEEREEEEEFQEE